MEGIATYVFLDLETTGLPSYELNKTKITELSMVAVKRRHLLDMTLPLSKNETDKRTPRVKHKLTLCFNPKRIVDPVSTEKTGLCNDLLEFERCFDKKAFDAINSFLNVLVEPICMVAHNGFNFDFPILRNHLEKLSVSFSKDVMCADTFYAFYNILECSELYTNKNVGLDLHNELVKIANIGEKINELSEQQQMQIENESTPHGKRTRELDTGRAKKVRRKLPWSDSTKPKDSYKLEDIYKRLVSLETPSAHQAENDCIMALEISVTLKEKFVMWIDRNCCPLSDIDPMRLGVSIR